ncbi:hypothetical protein FBU59_001704 [Linderina macrospora]|uniref:Uncharacterized protein n=1 Tax=Linderina macrospora TaxID=4868 RepID=A0ACC1JDD3_9FUNG|nr:hypothetical protein FBU59_001704 [Linderina macrospora]
MANGKTRKHDETDDSQSPAAPSPKRAHLDAAPSIFTKLGLPMTEQLQNSYTYISPLPPTTPTDTYVLGVDEAGRGPVLGPMVYAVSFCKEASYDTLKTVGFADSKQLTEAKRDSLFAQMQTEAMRQYAGWAIRCLSPTEISQCMLQKSKYNLNSLAHDATIGLIREVIGKGINVTRVFVDTVGPPDSYQRKLAQVFPGIEVTVAKKADSLYPIVSAASICAKVPRDAHLSNWVFEEGVQGVSRVYGSGYPGDPNTVKWLKEHVDAVFGYPNIIRFSWSTCVKLLEEHAAPVVWPEDEEPGYGSLKFNNAGRHRSKFFSRKRPLVLSSAI